MTLALRIASPDDLSWINQCYRDIDFWPTGPDDFQVVAELGGQRAGLGRIVPLSGGVGELGGMVVFEQFRGGGVAKEIIAFLAANPGFDSLYCLPFAKLERLYESFGFRRVDADAGTPAQVVEKFQWCQQFYPEPVLLMQLPPAELRRHRLRP